MILDIESLRLLWWLLLGILFMGFAITDGFDLGVAMLFPFIAKTETEKRIVLNTIGPFWEGNQVWIILGAGAVFAAWPYVYAVAFSGFYLLMFLLLLTLGISRPVSFKYRSKLPQVFWRHFWDKMVFVGGLVPAFIFGLIVGNILLGIPFYFDDMLRVYYLGHFTALFQPFAIGCGIVSMSMLIMHGGLYLAIKTEDPIRSRAIYWAQRASLLLIIFFAVGGFWLTYIPGYVLMDAVNHAGPSNPLHKSVGRVVGGWLYNYVRFPTAMVIPGLGFIGACCACLTASIGNSRWAFFYSSLSIIGIIGTVGITMFPFLLPSNVDLKSSLLIWDASSGHFTLLLMLFAVLVFMPIIILYTSWVYYMLRGKVRAAAIEKGDQLSLY